MISTSTGCQEGGCTCGHVRYRMLKAPMFVHCCHCRWCQRETGSAFVINAIVEKTEVEITRNQPILINTPSQSGKGQKIHRCPECHIALWSTYAGAGDQILFLRVGTLDDPDSHPPNIHVFAASKQPWFELPSHTPAVPEFYRFKDFWSEQSLDRFKAALSP